MLNFVIRSVLVVGLGWGCGLALAADKKEAAEPVVKKSDAGICHDKSSPSFGNTKKFTAFASMDECVKSGGKLPAGQPAAAAPAAPKAVLWRSAQYRRGRFANHYRNCADRHRLAHGRSHFRRIQGYR